jgi:hypothetical protein
VDAAGQGVPPTIVGESGPKLAPWSTSVGESEGSLLAPPGMFTSVGESEESLPEAGWSIKVGESDGVGSEPEEELSPFEGVRIAAPPAPGSEGFRSGRPGENFSIDDLGQ